MVISKAELADARENWGAGLIKISKTYEQQGIEEARKIASDIIEDIYGYSHYPVLFKPTLSGGEQTFRPTRKGALSYFIGHDNDYPLDIGFALRGWRHMTTDTSATFIDGDIAMWMGWMILQDKEGQATKVDKSFGYKKDENGKLRIVLHHSSLPYQP